MKEEELDALFRQKRNAEETIGLAEINSWLKAGVIVGAGAGAVVAAKWILTKKLLLMTFGILTFAGAVTTATLYLAGGGENLKPVDKAGSFAGASAVRTINADLDSVPVKIDSLRKPENAAESPLLPLSPLSPLAPPSPLSPLQSKLPPLSKLRILPDTLISVDNFDRIVAKGLLRLRIVHGNECKIAAPSELTQYLDWKVENGEITIEGSDKDFPKGKELVLYVKKLKELDLEGYSHAVVEDGFPLEDLELNISGYSGCTIASGMRRLNLEISGSSKASIASDIEDVRISVSGLSRLNLSGKIGSVDAELSGMVEMDMKGSANVGHISISGQSRLHAGGSEIKELSIDVSGSSGAEVLVTTHIDASASGMSTVIYSGNPRIIEKTTTDKSEIKSKS